LKLRRGNCAKQNNAAAPNHRLRSAEPLGARPRHVENVDVRVKKAMGESLFARRFSDGVTFLHHDN
jgi:hypothetical protein